MYHIDTPADNPSHSPTDSAPETDSAAPASLEARTAPDLAANPPPAAPIESDLPADRVLTGTASETEGWTPPRHSGVHLQWRQVSRQHPCAICGRPDWCSYAEGGVWASCRRMDRHTSFGQGREKTDKGGALYWLYRLQPAPVRGTAWEEPRYHHREAKGERADADTLDQVYRLLLNNLPFTAAHQEALVRRGLTDRSWQTCRGYRTLGKGRARAVQAVIRAGLESKLPGVPGLFVQEKGGGKRYWTIAGSGGLLIPIHDERGRIVALSVRVDDASGGGKYRYVSGKKHGGASPGSPVHVPVMRVADKRVVRITEGALKADIATKLSGMLTIGLPGVSSWQRGIQTAKAIGAETVRVAFDADARTNHMVAGHLARLIEGLRKAEIGVELETWDPADGKGIDDVLAGGKMPTVMTAAADIDRAIAETLAVAEKADPKPGEQMEAEDDPHRLARLYLATLDQPHSSRGKVLRYWRGQFWRWTGTCYRHLPDGEARAVLNAVIKQEFDRLAKEARCDWKAAGGRQKPPVARQVVGTLVGNVTQALAGLTLLPVEVEQPCWLGPKDCPEPRSYVALANGLLDVDALLAGRSEVLRPHSPCWFSPACLPYPFDLGADCPRWRAFLEKNLEADSERMSLLQEWFGYCLTFDTSLQRFLVLEGEGANGKSVICAALAAMLGRDNVAHVPLEKFADRFSLTQTLGKLANIVAEVGELDKAAEGTLKMFTAGDRMMFDRKGIAPIEAMPTARFIMATNNRPRFSDRSGGLWRRMILFPLRVTIPDAERVPGMDKAEWWQASGELPGIFNWALVGLHRLRREKRFTKSTVCSQALEQYRTEANPARLFLQETCVPREGCHVIKAVLYREYRDWCARNGRQPLANTEFGKEVRRAFPTVKEGKQKHGDDGKRLDCYRALAFDPDAADPEQLLLPLPLPAVPQDRF